MNFVFVDDECGLGQFGSEVDDFSQLIEFVFAHGRAEYIVLVFEAAFDLADKVPLLEPDLLFLLDDFCVGFVFLGDPMSVPHFYF